MVNQTYNTSNYFSHKKKNTSFPQVSPIDVIPILQQTYENKQKKKGNSRAKGKTAILIDSSYKNELQQQQLNQKRKNC